MSIELISLFGYLPVYSQAKGHTSMSKEEYATHVNSDQWRKHHSRSSQALSEHEAVLYLKSLDVVPRALHVLKDNMREALKNNQIRATFSEKSISVWGYSNYVEFLNHNAIPYSKTNYSTQLDAWGIQYSSEVPLRIEGKLYKVDFLVQLDGSSVYLEIDGISHYSTKSWHLKVAAESKGISVEECLSLKKARDHTIDSYLREKGFEVVRIQDHAFRKLSKSDFIKRIQGGSTGNFASKYDSNELSIWLAEGLTINQISERKEVAYSTVWRWLKESSLDLPTHEQDKLKALHERDYALGHQYLSGRNLTELSTMFNIQRTAVANKVEALGVKENLTDNRSKRGLSNSPEYVRGFHKYLISKGIAPDQIEIRATQSADQEKLKTFIRGRMKLEGASASEIARHENTTPAAVKNSLQKLGLSRCSGESRSTKRNLAYVSDAVFQSEFKEHIKDNSALLQAYYLAWNTTGAQL